MYASRKIKYAYICEHCGHRNEKFYEISDQKSKTDSNIIGGAQITTTYTNDYIINALRERLRNKTPNFGKIDNKHEHARYKNFNSKCSNCEKRQRWSTQYFYNISFVIIAILILLVALDIKFYEYLGDTIASIIVLGALLLFLATTFFWSCEGLIGNLAGKRVKNECSIPEIIEIGEITFS